VYLRETYLGVCGPLLRIYGSLNSRRCHLRGSLRFCGSLLGRHVSIYSGPYGSLRSFLLGLFVLDCCNRSGGPGSCGCHFLIIAHV
jgi:hypothetical protein